MWLVLAFLASFVTVAQDPKELTLSAAAQAVVLLHAPAASGATSLGTGFLANLNGQLFLLTAEHVAKGLTQNVSVTFGDEKDIATSLPLAQLAGSANPRWTFHGVADVAVMHLKPAGRVAALLAPRALTPGIFIKNLEVPDRNRPLTTVGYPLGLGGLLVGPDKRISPLSRESKPASGLLTLPRADTKQPVVTFLLDSPSIGGFSGAPVFVLPSAFSQGAGLVFSAGSFCVGLVHGTWSDNTGGKLAAIVPVAFIVETLEKAYAAAGRAP